jgi:hypothetical protein
MIFYVHIWFGYTGYRNGSSCKRQEGSYTLFITVSSITIEAVTPILVMTIFSLLTFKNLHGLHQRRNRILPTTHTHTQMIMVRPMTMNNVTGEFKQTSSLNQQSQREQNKISKQLTMITFIQVLVYIMFNTMNGSYALYSVVTTSIIRSADQAATESFISTTAILLTFVYGTVS